MKPDNAVARRIHSYTESVFYSEHSVQVTFFFAYNGEDTWKTKTPESWDPPDKPVPSPGPLGRFGFTTKNTAEPSGTDEQKQEELLAIKEKK